MAAVLCGGIGKAISGCCECAGQLCMLPFKLCGACCEGCSNCCSETCKGLSQCCSESCKFVTSCCSSSFCCYITVACALNIPGIVVGLTDVPNAVAGCNGSLWLLVFWILSVVHIVAAFYMAYAVEKDESILPQGDEEGGFSQTAQNGASRMKHLFCYDVWMAAYILVVCGYFGWMLLGGAWFATGTMDDAENCEESINGRVGIAFAFGWAFIFMGGCGLCCSLCCGLFTGMGSGNNSSQHYVNTQPPTSTTTNSNPAVAAIPSNDNVVKAEASASAPDNNNKASYAGNSTTSKPVPAAASNEEAMEVEVEAVPVHPKASAPMATATPY